MEHEDNHQTLFADSHHRPIVITVQFRIARTVGQGLQLGSIKRRARGALVTDVRFDCAEKRSGELRIACSMPMAIFFVGELKQLEARARAQRNHSLAADCTRAIATTFKAIEDGDRASTAPRHTPVNPPSIEHRA
jgi:hypothetical protein